MAPLNIVMILTDDLGWRDLACCGSRFYETPNLDRLAGEGIRFTQAYGTCPVCSPSRASIHTGRYPARLGLTQFIGCPRDEGRLFDAPYIDHLPAGEHSLAEALRAGGYRTWHVGKWHLGDSPEFFPDRHGFDVNVGGADWGPGRGGYFSPYRHPALPDGPAGEFLTDRLTDEAIRLIRSSDGRPFFLHLAHHAVHIPIQAKPADIARFEARARELGLDRQPAFEEGEPFPFRRKADKRVVRRLVQSDPAYAAMVWNLDWNVGRLLAAIEDAGLAGDTAVVFTSDNGGLATAEGSPTCNLPLAEGKGWMYEGGTRVPLLVRWPGVARPGELCAVPVTGTDFYPTMLEMAGLPPIPEQHCDGESLVPLLRGEGDLKRDAIFWHYPHYGNQGGTPASSIRSGDHKLIEFFEDGRLELYDLRVDSGEDRNLAGDMPALAGELRGRLRDWRASVSARLTEPNPDWRPR